MTLPVQPISERCRETAGFLFSHPCKNPAVGRCDHCGKPICAEHSRPSSAEAPPEQPAPGGWPAAGGTVCVGCARRQVVASGGQNQQAFREDPLFCAWALGGSSWDYTEEDHAAFQVESTPVGAEAWERDWDAS
jgi:hypothetical protein